MRRSTRSLLLLVILVPLIAVLFSIANQRYRFVERAQFDWQMFWQSDSQEAIGLDQYRAVIEGQVIDGLTDDVSGLSYDPDRKSLFTVTNQNAEMVELSLDGHILRRIKLIGFGDAEAVEYISPGVYVISDERQQRLIKVHIDDDTQSVDAANAEQLTLGLNAGGNKGYEGLAYDRHRERLFVARERDPVQIIEVRGFPKTNAEGPGNLQVISDSKRDAGLFVRDLSSLQFDQNSGHLLALSDESRQIVELDIDGRPIGSGSLKKGQMGLSKTVPQAEGVAMDDDEVLYLVSEPNLFYVFRKP
ncbi:SdiA-regulated domain-containing protein [Pseudomonas viridiflava]|uniref:SdiA-regulated domain-containing protein n=1 Tax=Pseudomonas viridiflava TaxID=33069 RepID=UPI00083F89E6|nr:SdiA-regulated domain-containing protein [Pseudomonas viridiflava]MBI6578541.1 SdiA-regulated domain-containing protein [Pseudomonas viridiflava]MBI6607965.1 SdiA-regulated domain-containing protein [Pseudomonas viridiflava]MBI6639232.1 SdiA-regulated domain-containing protein [Pseudomonas viridiflava]MBI6868061.1 SdiA-regulated domain-containing protein [Pseudomonas viridiflava]ODJ93500.1 DNA-binding protein [Pseudomonas viridiflava]